jgi:hypothetical protein
MTSFQKLFQEADEHCGLSSTFSFPQEDVTQFEAAYQEKTEDGKSKVIRNQVAIPDMEKLRNMIQKINYQADDENGDVVLGSYSKQVILPKIPNINQIMNNSSIRQPYYEWEKEVREAMEVDPTEKETSNDVEYDSDADERTNSKLRKTKLSTSNVSRGVYQPSFSVSSRIHKLEMDIAPYSCFDTDFVDVNCQFDPLDKIFHNQSHPEDSLMSVDSMEYLSNTSNEKRKAEIARKPLSVRENLFNKFSKADSAPDPTTTTTNVVEEEDFSRFLSPDDEARKQKILKEKLRLQEKIQRIKSVGTWMDASQTLVKTTAKRTRDVTLQSRLKLIAAFNHSPLATFHRNTIPDLKQIELKYFHRPRMFKERDRPWSISLKVKSSSRKVKNLQNEVGKVVVIAEEDKQNLSLVNSDQKFILIEYAEEFPPVMLNHGMASSVVNYFRSSSTATASEIDVVQSSKGGSSGHKEIANTSSSQNPADDSAVDFHKRKVLKKSSSTGNNEILSEKEIENIKKQISQSGCLLPRHLLLLWELNHTKRSYEHDANIPKQPLGSTKVLNPEDPSPFLGNIEEGELQIAFENNLFRSPLFYHSPATSDFLLIRTKLSSTALNYSVREFPSKYPCLFLSGQIEPQVVVPRPIVKLTPTQENFYKLTILRYLLSHPNGVTLNEVVEHVLKYSSKEVSTPHKYYHRNMIKEFLKEMADEIRDNSSASIMLHKFFLKDFSMNPDLEAKYSMENLARSFTPEDVCIQESCNAAEYRLLQSNITDMELMKVQVYLNYLHLKKQFCKERFDALKIQIEDYSRRYQSSFTSSSSSSSAALPFATWEQFQLKSSQLLEVLSKEIFRIQKKQQIARFLLERLMVAPWNTTEVFVNSVIKNDSLGKMDVRGKGDPSGRGEGFAYVRLPKIAPPTATKGSAAAGKKDDKDSNKLVGTDRDLRKLTKVDAIALLVALKVKREEAMALNRWDRIHMIRSMVDNLVSQGTINEYNLSKYVRDPNLLLKLKSNQAGEGANQALSFDEFKKICNEIWARQKAALSTEIRPLQAKQDRLTYQKELTRREKKKLKKQELLSPRFHRGKQSPRNSSFLGELSSSEDEVNDNEKEKEEEEGEDDEEEMDSSDDSDASFIEKALSNRPVTNPFDAKKSEEMKRQEEEKMDLQQFKASMLQGQSSQGQQQQQLKKKITVGIAGGVNNLSNNATPRETPGSSQSQQQQQMSTSSSSYLQSQLNILQGTNNNTITTSSALSMRYPPKIIKRITKSTSLDGKETIKIEFIVSENEIHRLQSSVEKMKQERKERRTMTALSHHPFTRSGRGGYGRGGGGGGGAGDSDDELLNNPSMSLNMSKLKQRVDEHNQIQSFIPTSKKDRPLTIKTQKGGRGGRDGQGAGMIGLGDRELEVLSNIQANKSSKRSLSAQQSYLNPRLPRVSLAMKLEKEVMTIWGQKESELFRYPVDRSLYPDYYHRIVNPISLQDIREKCVSYQYESVEQFLRDFQLMHENSERYNRAEHIITKTAKKIFDNVKLNIEHEKEMFKEGNIFGKLESLIQQKKVYYRRGLQDLVGNSSK